MALIQKTHFSRITKDHYRVHEPVDASYSILYEGENKYLQIDTYGSAERQIKGKTSQSIQIDDEMARELVSILKREFSIN